MNSEAAMHTVTASQPRAFGMSPDHALRAISQVWITIGLSVAAIALHFSGALSTALQYSSGDGTWWQLLSCHLTHWNLNQLLWDVAAFFALGVVCERTNRHSFVFTLVGSALAIPLVTTWCYPQIDSYRGLSGIDSALFTLLACQLVGWGLQNKDRKLILAGLVAWLIFIGKSGFEAMTLGTLFVSATSDFVSLPVAHVVGAVAGTLAWVIPRRPQKGTAIEGRQPGTL